jgi:hypothetical protein
MNDQIHCKKGIAFIIAGILANVSAANTSDFSNTQNSLVSTKLLTMQQPVKPVTTLSSTIFKLCLLQGLHKQWANRHLNHLPPAHPH